LVSGKPKTQFDAMRTQFRRNSAANWPPGKGLVSGPKTQLGVTCVTREVMELPARAEVAT
jgi:hypothetical protein